MTAPLSIGGAAFDTDVALDLRAFLAEMDEEARRALDLTPAWAKVDAIVTAFLQKRFATDGAHLGTKWAKLSKSQIAARKRPGHGRGGILHDTSPLWASFTKAGGPGSIREMRPMLYLRGSSDPKAAIHQRGATIKRIAKVKQIILERRRTGGRRGMGAGLKRYSITIPARPIIPEPLPPALVDEITAAVAAWLATGKR